ncbi:cupin domain-containing protein [Tothia fuscella]|uniref:Cupin domain-containing protein n=1 Tax=Tothia fuscella TaxID=1048955 RepID=A0A9P4TV77_9PEZI|nr:cupin domain-containing protein [Tothia fuscella]
MVKVVEDPIYSKDQPPPSIKIMSHFHLKNVPNFSIVTLQVSFPPGGASPPHRHAGASVSGIVTKGSGYNKMNDGPTHLLTEQETWYEAPGCHHKISANASQTEAFVLLATMVVETKVIDEGGYAALVEIDEEYKDMKIPM